MTALLNNPLLPVLAIILGFGFLIFVHELGHFAVAKWVGIRATQFAIGFGNAICAYRKGIGFRMGGTEKEYRRRALEHIAQKKQAAGQDIKTREDGTADIPEEDIYAAADELGLGETEYRLNTLPLGGYVKMLGQEDMDPKAQSNDPRSFNRKSVGARAAVISAGVIMNLIFGVVFFMAAFGIGVDFNAAVVGYTTANQPAATTYADGHEGDADYLGLQPGDVITHVNGKPAKDMTEVRIAIALGSRGKPVKLTVDRDGQDEPLTYSIVAKASKRTEGLLSAGIAPADTLTVAENTSGSALVGASSAFADQGITPGMAITAINGQPVENWGQYIRAVAAATQPEAAYTFTDPDGNASVTVTAPLSPSLEQSEMDLDGDNASVQHLLGLTPATSITMVSPDSPAEDAGLQSGDILAKLGEKSWPIVDEVSGIVQDAPDDGLAVIVQRDGQLVDLGKVEPNRKGILGIRMTNDLDLTTVARALDGSPLAAADPDRPLPAGSKWVSINGQPIDTWTTAQATLADALAKHEGDEPVKLELGFEVNLGDNPTETYTLELPAKETAATLAALSWKPASGIGFDPLMTTLKADTPIEATMIGLDKTKQFIEQTYITLLRLVQGTIGVKNLRGPVGIVNEGRKIATQGLPYYLFFIGLISVNLAVLNFLPIPIVDGGLMVFLIVEKIKGSPASPALQTAVTLVGLVCLASIFLFVTFYDVAELITGTR